MNDKNLPISTSGELTLDVLSALASSVPYLGGPLSSIINGVAGQRRAKRFREFVVALKADLEKLQTHVDDNYVKSEEFEELVHETVQRVVTEVREERRELYRRFLLGATQSPLDSYDEQKKVLKLFDDIQGDHIRVLQALLQEPEGHGHPGIPGSAIGTLMQRLSGMSQVHIERLVRELAEMGLAGVNCHFPRAFPSLEPDFSGAFPT